MTFVAQSAISCRKAWNHTLTIFITQIVIGEMSTIVMTIAFCGTLRIASLSYRKVAHREERVLAIIVFQTLGNNTYATHLSGIAPLIGQ